MFWRRSRKTDDASAHASASPNKEDDLAKLQRQFGIKTVSDKDVEADFLQLLGSTGKAASASTSAFGLSPRTERALFGDGDSNSDEEAQILRQLNLSGTVDSIDADALSGSDDENDADAAVAKRELQGVLGDAHREAARNAAKNDPVAPALPPPQEVSLRERIHAMKLEAVALKRSGNTQAAIAVFREVKTLEAQLAGGGSSAVAAVQTTTTTVTTAVKTTQQTTVSVVDKDEEEDVEITDEDMENPEYLAQLAALGLSVAKPSPPPAETVESLNQAIREAKERALQFKRSDRIPDALAEMRKIKELEAKLAALQPNTPASIPTPTPAAPPVISPPVVVPPLPEPTHDSDVEVTDEDMNDPAFAAELQKMGFDPSAMSDDPESAEEKDDDVAAPMPVVPGSHNVRHYVKRCSSVDDSDLIDEFEEDEEEEEKPNAPVFGNETKQPVPLPQSSEEEITNAPTVVAPQELYPHAPGPQEQEAQVQEPSAGFSVEELQLQLEKTKLLAVQLKRQGNIQGALDMMRRMKQIEHLIEMKQRGAPAPEPVISSDELERKRTFGELEALLVRFANEATQEAKDQLSINRTKAAEWLARRKEYSALLAVLREKRQITGQEPPPYHIEALSEQVEVGNTDVLADEVHLRIDAVNDFGQAAGKDVFVKFNLSFPSSAPHEGRTSDFRIDSTAPCSGRVTSNNLFRVKVQRGRGTQRLFEIKKAVFEVWRPGSLLRNPEFIARGYQELAPLLTSSEVKNRVVFVGPNRKPVGGDVEISLRLRTPLRDKEYKTLITEIIHVGEYPPPVVIQTPPMSRPAARSEPPPHSIPRPPRPHSSSEVPAITNSAPLPHTQSAPSLPAMATNPSSLDDPHDLDLIISYDVINDEIERIESALPTLQGEQAAEYSDRLDALGLKKQLLEIDMQTGKLTLDMYVARLKQRILDDRAIIKQLVKSGRKPDAARVLHRVKIMEKELLGTEEQDEAGDAEQ